MSNSTKFRGLMFGVSVLPALLVMPALAADYTETVTDSITGEETININVADTHGIETNGTIEIGGDGTNSISLTAGNRGIYAKSGANVAMQATDNINIDAGGQVAVLALGGAIVDLNADDIKISAQNSESSPAAVWAQNNTTEGGEGKTQVNITAENATIQSAHNAINAFSQGEVDITAGNLIIDGADNAISVRGNAIVNINTDGEHTTQMDGNIAFDYFNKPEDPGNSGTAVDATVNVTLNGADSYWNGNTIVSYEYNENGKPGEDTLDVTGMSLTLKNGATWNASKIEDVENVDKGVTSGSYYVALNNLNINNGVVNIQDTERGITVDNAIVADATFNGGPLNIGTKLDITGGENLFAGDILGDGALNVASGAVMNIGDAIVNLSSITLDGTMIANLTEGSDTAKITADTFTGDGNLSLILDKAGEYNIFGNATVDNVEIDSVLYGIKFSEDGKTFTATEKSVAQVAADSNLTVDAAQSVVNLTKSSSDALNDLGVRAQEALAVKDSAAVEHATRAINPETASVAQSVTTSVQNTVANLVAGRMASIAPVGMTGRAGGDTSLTAGGVWAQGLFNKSKSNDLFDGETMGVAAGIDGTIGRDFSIGAGYSFAASDIDASARNTDIDSHTVFVYGQYKPSQWYANAMLNYTMSSYTESGDALGVLIDSEYDIDSFGGQIATGYDFASGITPQIAVRYLHIGGADYTNSLGVASEIADSDYLTGVLGAKYAFDYNPSESVRIRPEVRAAVKYDFLSDNAVSTVTMPGVNAYVISGERLNRLGGEFGLGVTMTYAGVDVSLNYDIEVREDYTSQTGMVRARYNF